MKIVVLEGSPNKNGSSDLLAGRFIEGAREAGHTVEVIDAAHSNIRPCTGCIRCGYEGPCVQKDDVEGIRAKILAADMLVFVTPLYYYGMSAQLKTLVDRFCAFNSSIQRKHMQSAMIAAAWNSDGWTFEALESTIGPWCATSTSRTGARSGARAAARPARQGSQGTCSRPMSWAEVCAERSKSRPKRAGRIA